jgi:hypothetical protein
LVITLRQAVSNCKVVFTKQPAVAHNCLYMFIKKKQI